MRNREEGLTRAQSPMGGTPKPTANSLVNQTYRELPSARETAIDKLLTAYNSKAYANPYAPLLTSGTSNYTTADGAYHDDTSLAAWKRNGDRLGFVNRDFNTRNGLEYGLGLDIGDPNRGVYDTSVNTPIGTLGYGYDGDTTGVSYNPTPQIQEYIQTLANLLYR